MNRVDRQLHAWSLAGAHLPGGGPPPAEGGTAPRRDAERKPDDRAQYDVPEQPRGVLGHRQVALAVDEQPGIDPVTAFGLRQKTARTARVPSIDQEITGAADAGDHPPTPAPASTGQRTDRDRRTAASVARPPTRALAPPLGDGPPSHALPAGPQRRPSIRAGLGQAHPSARNRGSRSVGTSSAVPPPSIRRASAPPRPRSPARPDRPAPGRSTAQPLGRPVQQRHRAAGVAALGVGQPDRQLRQPPPELAFRGRGRLPGPSSTSCAANGRPASSSRCASVTDLLGGQHEIVRHPLDAGRIPGKRAPGGVAGACVAGPPRGIAIPTGHRRRVTPSGRRPRRRPPARRRHHRSWPRPRCAPAARTEPTRNRARPTRRSRSGKGS